MGNYLDKWKTLFPEVVGGTKRPLEAISDQDEFNTNGFPQFIAQDPVRYDLQNAFLKQFLSNDAWLWVRQQQAYQALDRHKDDAQAHPNGVSGNAASATKLQTARSLNLGGAVTADAATFDGTADTTINVKTLDATKLKGTASVSTTGNAATATKLQTARTLSLTGKAAGSTTFDGSANASINVKFVNADTASKLSTARKINITGNASGSTTFDGTSDVSINVNVSQAAHADKATADKYGADIADNYIKHYINVSTQDLNDVRVGGLYAQSLNANATTARHYPENEACSILVIQNGANGVDGCTQICTTFASHNSYKREYDVASKTWSAWRRYAFEDSTVANAQKLATPRAISLTGNASGSANFDGSGNVSINTTVNESKHAATATALDIFAYRPSDANIQKGDGLVRHFLATSGMSKNNPPEGDGHILSFAWDNNGGYDAQLCVNNSTGRINMRGQNAGKWSDWLTVLDSANFNSYAPTKTGGGASGTWGINISGNAASATNADKVNGYHASDLLGKIYPVGSIYMSMSATNPHDLFGVGTWKRISQGRMLLGADDSTYKAGATGGEATHTLTAAEMPAHSHGISTSGDHSHYFYGSDGNNGPLTEGDGLDTEGNSHFTRNVRFTTSSAGAHTHTISNSGGGAAHNNMSPYLVCYIWQRTA